MSATCRGCGAAVVWVVTTNGKSMPLDAAPTESGNITLQQPDDPREPQIAVMIPAGPRPPMPRFTSHFATCPKAAAFRMGRVPR